MNKIEQFENERENQKTNEQDLHLTAGLVDGGLDEDGDQEWIGTAKNWNKYKELYAEYVENQEQKWGEDRENYEEVPEQNDKEVIIH